MRYIREAGALFAKKYKRRLTSHSPSPLLCSQTVNGRIKELRLKQRLNEERARLRAAQQSSADMEKELRSSEAEASSIENALNIEKVGRSLNLLNSCIFGGLDPVERHISFYN